MPMPTPSHPKTFRACLVSIALTGVVGGALYFVTGETGVGMFALSVAFAIGFIWAARNVEAIADHLSASARQAALVPARTAAPPRRKGV